MILYEVIPARLFVSNMPRARDRGALDARGVTALVSLTRQPPPLEVTVGLDWLHVPLPDSRDVPLAGLETVRRWVQDRLRAGAVVLLHCREGRNRAALVGGLLARWYYGWSGEAAYWHIVALRPNALYNEAFATYLRGLP